MLNPDVRGISVNRRNKKNLIMEMTPSLPKKQKKNTVPAILVEDSSHVRMQTKRLNQSLWRNHL